MNLNNVKVKMTFYEISEKEKIEINKEAMEKSEIFAQVCTFTPEGVLSFCRNFKKENGNKASRGEYYQEAPQNTLGLHTIFEKKAPKSFEYAVLAHILLAQGRIRSKIVCSSANGEDSSHAFVLYFQNGKKMILDAALQEEIVELDSDGIYKHYSKKRNQTMLYNQNIKHSILVSPLEDVPDYNPQK
ncbi:MAG: hypothetical protein RRX93_01175 [Bacteroidales bacterium]